AAVFTSEKPSVQAGILPVAVTTGNFNADMRPDVVLADQGKNGVELAQTPLPIQIGTFVLAAICTAGPSDVAVVNYDTDNHPDIAAVCEAEALDFGVPTSGLAIADFNHDGHPDIAAAGDAEVVVLLGKGNGMFAPAIALPGLPGGRSLEAADLNGDGYADLVEGSTVEKRLGVFMNGCSPRSEW